VPGKGLSPSAAIKEFRSRARSILWRQDPGKTDREKLTYLKFQRLTEEFQKGGAMTLNQATVQAAKDFPCLNQLFREYDVSQYDPHPDSHPKTPKPDKKERAVRCEGEELSYRENISWALTAAGVFLRKGEEPKSCPNDQAYFLYIQAKEQPKEFMQRLGQVESKVDPIEEEDRRTRKAGRRSVEEIERMLSRIQGQEEREGSMAA